MMGGIIIGDMSISTTLTTVSIIPSILFAFIGAKYAGKHGNKKTIVTWTYMCIYVTCATILFFVFLHVGGNTRKDFGCLTADDNLCNPDLGVKCYEDVCYHWK